MIPAQTDRGPLRVVLFSGGRGSGVLTELLATDPRIALTIAINGYDDGASTGEVRRVLGDALGPSDFRKNASRVARLRRSCPPELIEFLDARLPDRATLADARMAFEIGRAAERDAAARVFARLAPDVRAVLATRWHLFAAALEESGSPFDFSDCSIGNLVFAGTYLLCARRFNDAVDDYCALLGLPPGVVENVTAGENAFLVALDANGRLLGSEEEIVGAKGGNSIKDIFLIREPLTDTARTRLQGLPPPQVVDELVSRSVVPAVNPRLVPALRDADLIIYAPGTQHSSLFPSYLTAGLSAAIASNLHAIKLLVTNIQTDAEIAGSSAVDLVERAAFYLRDKGRLTTPAPCFITHYLLNDPGRTETSSPYVPLGSLDSIEDPRLIRVGHYEQAATGRHDAAKILGPFVDAFLARARKTPRVAVLLHDAGSRNKIAQTILEMIRGGIADLHVQLAVFHHADAELDAGFVQRLGFPVRRLQGTEQQRDEALRRALVDGQFDYVILFESSGMYNGEDIAGLASFLRSGRLDAVWGSRRLSVRDIHESYRLKYRKKAFLGAASYAGSHVLSLACLALYGRYVSDTLSGARAVRTGDALALDGPLTDKLANQRLLSTLLRRRAEMLEVPVQFFSISPDRVRRTTIADGLRAALVLIAGRVRQPRVPASPAAADAGHPSRAWIGS